MRLRGVAGAANGHEAAALSVEHRPDVVVMDVAMPILNGIEAARQTLAKQPQTATIRVSNKSFPTARR